MHIKQWIIHSSSNTLTPSLPPLWVSIASFRYTADPIKAQIFIISHTEYTRAADYRIWVLRIQPVHFNERNSFNILLSERRTASRPGAA